MVLLMAHTEDLIPSVTAYVYTLDSLGNAHNTAREIVLLLFGFIECQNQLIVCLTRASARQIPWPGEPHSNLYSFRRRMSESRKSGKCNDDLVKPMRLALIFKHALDNGR
jgi:hypothetical protein